MTEALVPYYPDISNVDGVSAQERFFRLLFGGVESVPLPSLSEDTPHESSESSPLIDHARALLQTKSEQQLDILGTVIQEGPLTINAVRKRLSSAKSTTTATLARFARVGLVTVHETKKGKSSSYLYSVGSELETVLSHDSGEWKDQEVMPSDIARLALSKLVEFYASENS